MKQLKKRNLHQSKKINHLISDQQSEFKIPSKTVQDGADKLPTVQVPA